MRVYFDLVSDRQSERPGKKGIGGCRICDIPSPIQGPPQTITRPGLIGFRLAKQHFNSFHFSNQKSNYPKMRTLHHSLSLFTETDLHWQTDDFRISVQCILHVLCLSAVHLRSMFFPCIITNDAVVCYWDEANTGPKFHPDQTSKWNDISWGPLRLIRSGHAWYIYTTECPSSSPGKVPVDVFLLEYSAHIYSTRWQCRRLNYADQLASTFSYAHWSREESATKNFFFHGQ